MALKRIAQHPPEDISTGQNKKKSKKQKPDGIEQQIVSVSTMTMSNLLLFAADVAGLIHTYRVPNGEYLGCVPIGRSTHVVALHCCNESSFQGKLSSNDVTPTAPKHDTLLALCSDSTLVIMNASPYSNPVLAVVSRYDLDSAHGTVWCMAVIKRLLFSSVPGMKDNLLTGRPGARSRESKDDKR